MEQNLEALIQEHAAMMAQQMAEIARYAESEEELRIGCTKLIDDFIGKANLKIKGRHEYGLAGGRIDSKYGGVVIEYKDPKRAGKLSENRETPGVRAVVAQIQKRFTDLQRQEQVGMERIFGVGCDGSYIVFVRLRGKQFDVGEPQPVTPYTIQRLLRALVSLGARGLSFTPDNLSSHFGEGSTLAEEGIHSIYKVISETRNPKAQTFFNQWQILFGEVCGYDIHGRSSRIDKLGKHYLIPKAKPAELLFAVHTYYAVFIKLLAAEIVSSFSPLGMSALKRVVDAPTSEKLRMELESLEQGGIWSQLGIRNFLEGDLFSWYLDVWDGRLEQTIRKMVGTLDDYDPKTLSVEPTESRDLLKKLYHRLFPKSVRHDLGEYFTPDWLAEFTLNELGYDGNPDKRLLDPACGSGTFLVMAINRIKAWFDEHRHECGFQEDELLCKILRNIIGFDLNPLAVMASRTNYLLAIRDLLRYGGDIELPVYLCDSIMTPSTYGDQSTGQLVGKATRLKTSVGEFLIPAEITTQRERIGKYADELEKCVRDDYDPDEFIAGCEAQGLPMAEKSLHKQLYGRLCELDTSNQNRVWARIIKNAFAPLFTEKVDYVAGNPPWVNWESLPEDYRDSMKPLWEQYGLFSLSGSEGRLGGGKKDLSMLFVYTAVDNYLPIGGRLGFVITQSVFKTKGAGDGFRRLQLMRADASSDDKNRNVHFKPTAVHDMSAMQLFEGATNRTAVFVCEKSNKPFEYPVPYVSWSGPSRIEQDELLPAVLAITMRSTLAANPVQPLSQSSPWLTARENALPGLQKVIGRSDYEGHAGCCTWLNAVYWIRILKTLPDRNLLIENLHDGAKIKVERVQTAIEPELVYPLLRGRDVSRWHAKPSCHIILPQDPQTRTGIPESKMKQEFPKTFAYLKRFEGDMDNPRRGTLRGRSGYKKYFKPTDPFYSMYDVGPYTMAPWKVVWAWISVGVKSGVVGQDESRPVIPEHNTSMVPFDNEIEAHYFSALFGSSPIDVCIRAFNPGGGGGLASPKVLHFVKIPRFHESDEVHLELSRLSMKCHNAASCGDQRDLHDLELKIDRLAAEIWSITPGELSAIREALGRQ
ncbi:MAG: N-6 DNA methylase [Candidatus Coatesbacteria bacterium]|nr:N-6 DNA methylase [Candidatus Coatesbacteria bacterium]